MKIKKFQEGGMAPEAAAPVNTPAKQPSQDQVMQQLQQIAAQIIQEMGPEAAAMLAQLIMEMLQAQEPVGAQPEEQRFYRKGGKICKAKKVKKACGGKKI